MLPMAVTSPHERRKEMTKKRYKKLIRAFLTDVHTYSKLVEGETDFRGDVLKKTSMKREIIDRVHPNWDVCESYEEAWNGLKPAWDSVKEAIQSMK